jgi:glutamate synthase (NADPH/NADH) large chain
VHGEFDPEDHIIAGNVLLYGATGGEAFFRGQVGERFCVRNSGATAVVEGVGDHACEYMTGGRAVILGPTGRNFGAGMSGGIAYVWDPDKRLGDLVNREMVDLDPLDDLDQSWLVTAVFRHQTETGSDVAARVLSDWQYSVKQFVKIMPRDYKRVLAAIRGAEESGADIDEAIMAAAKG